MTVVRLVVPAGLALLAVAGCSDRHPSRRARTATGPGNVEAITRWGGSWTTARACLVGDARSRDGREAMILRELLAPGELAGLPDCAPAIAQLGERAAGVPPALATATQQLATAFRDRIAAAATDDGRDDSPARSQLARTIGAADAAHAEAAREAGIDLEPLPGPEPLRLLQGERILAPDGGKLSVDLATTFSNTAVVYGTDEAGNDWEIRKQVGGASWHGPARDLSLVGGDGNWGAWRRGGPGDHEIRTGALGSNGKPTAEGVLIAHSDADEVLLGAAIGDRSRAVVYVESKGATARVRVALSRDAGATWRQLGTEKLALADWGGGIHIGKTERRVDLVHRMGKRLAHLEISERTIAGTPASRPRIPGTAAGPFCFSGRELWWRAGSETWYARDERTAPVKVPGLDPTADEMAFGFCGGQQMQNSLIWGSNAVSYFHCRPEGCRQRDLPVLPGTEGDATYRVDKPPIVMLTFDDIVVVRELDAQLAPAGQVTARRVPGRAVGIVDWDGAIHLLLWSETTAQIARL